jgi:hypothetical protein
MGTPTFFSSKRGGVERPTPGPSLKGGEKEKEVGQGTPLEPRQGTAPPAPPLQWGGVCGATPGPSLKGVEKERSRGGWGHPWYPARRAPRTLRLIGWGTKVGRLARGGCGQAFADYSAFEGSGEDEGGYAGAVGGDAVYEAFERGD